MKWQLCDSRLRFRSIKYINPFWRLNRNAQSLRSEGG